MRTFRIQVNGKTYTVSVEQAGSGRVRAKLGNGVYECQSVRNDGIATWLIRTSKEAVRAYTKSRHGHNVDVWLGGLPFPSSVDAVGVAGYTLPAEPVAETRVGGEIRALMPGRITSILVKQGDIVETGSPLLILEAMKMQNEIVSPIRGRVKGILVQEGVTVKKDSALIIVE